MPDRERVIKGLECCASMNDSVCRECPYSSECVAGETTYQTGIAHLAADALALLKDPDRIKVTRCKDCKHAKEWSFYRNSDRTILCALRDEATKPNWFCANGERR